MWDRAAAGSGSVRGCSRDWTLRRASSRRAIVRESMSSSMYACLYQPPHGSASLSGERHDECSAQSLALQAIAQAFSPRYECHHGGAGFVTIDVSGLDRLLGPPRV